MKIVGIAMVAWALGCAAYVVTLRTMFNQGMSSGDLRAVLFWSAAAALITAPLVFVPVMFRLRDRSATWIVFVLRGATLGFAPVLVLASIFGFGRNIARALISPEVGLFCIAFGTFGAVFGAGFHAAYCRSPVDHPSHAASGTGDPAERLK